MTVLQISQKKYPIYSTERNRHLNCLKDIAQQGLRDNYKDSKYHIITQLLFVEKTIRSIASSISIGRQLPCIRKQLYEQ